MTLPYLDALTATPQKLRLEQISQQLPQQRFWWVIGPTDKSEENWLFYDTQTRLLWDGQPNNIDVYKLEDAQNKLKSFTRTGLTDWRLPNHQQLWDLGGNTYMPLKSGSYRRIKDKDFWICANGALDMDNNTVYESASGRILCCHQIAKEKSALEFLTFCLTNQWRLRACADSNLWLDPLWQDPLSTLYADIDNRRANLPVLSDTQFTDPAKGLWEFWGADAETIHGARTRNPADDIKDWNVAIDFGTSSTVVAFTENGQSKLLRIGVNDFWQQQQPQDYENPTALEFVNFAAFLQSWQTEAYQPLVIWGDVRCSHEALNNLRHNETDSAVVASVLNKIKQWALREASDTSTRITDRHGLEHELTALTLLQPVKGEALTVNGDYPFDPVELYAWYLGLTINWRGRGIFLRYYMTFPVAYPAEVKQKILASFRRGLQRSLPVTLVGQPVLNQFKVEERASEPVAYAVAALPELAIEPTVDGVPYAVFDFGGGTADFDFGIYRLANEEEQELGIEKVLEQFGSSGDKFLGGENLLENIAYRVFLHNIDLCRTHKIAFTRPLDADDFPGSEMFLEKTQAALTNSLMLISRLRPFWETGVYTNSSGIEKIQLINRDSQKVSCELVIPEADLSDYLEERIQQGIYNFYVALKQAFSNDIPDHIHILLAGNASRSKIVQALFGLKTENDLDTYLELYNDLLIAMENLFGNQQPVFQAHPPLPADSDDVYRPTGKTGVALGLLKLCPGSPVEIINRSVEQSFGEAPFAFYVGRIKAQKFQPILKQGGDYQQWQEIGPYREGVFNLVYTQSPWSITGEMSDGEAGLIYKRLDLQGGNNRLFARIIAPDRIQIGTAADITATLTDSLDNLQELTLG